MKMNNAMIGFAISLFILGPILLFIFEPETRFNYQRPKQPVLKANDDETRQSYQMPGLKDVRVTALAHASDGSMYVGTAFGLSRSKDGGKTFQPLDFDGSVGDDSVTSVVVGDQALFVAVRYTYDQFSKALKTPLFVSRDRGESFQPVVIPKEFLHREVEALSLDIDGRLYLSIGTSFITSGDLGETFQLVSKK